MTEMARNKKVVSETRRQQNRAAQKNYRDRQKRQLRLLKHAVESREVVAAGPALGDEDVVVPSATDSSDLVRSSHDSPGQNSLCPLGTIDAEKGVLTKSLADGLRDALARGLTVTDILAAGLEALSSKTQTPSHAASSEHAEQLDEQYLRTDKILVLLNIPTTANVHANHLHLKLISNVAALRANCDMLGVTFEQVQDEETISPFHVSYQASCGMDLSSATYQHLSPCLRPIHAQFTLDHHPYIDALPFPLFRERLLEAITIKPELEYEVCADIANDGLICWGSSLGDGVSVHGTGTPWDHRSWEAQDWFLRKWAWLVGGEDGELWMASKWWMEMRGDRMVVS